MTENAKQQARNVLSNLSTMLPDLETVYKDIHSHPELSMQETRTAGIAAERLRSAGYEVTTGVGKTGVVGILRNGRKICPSDACMWPRHARDLADWCCFVDGEE